MECKEEGEGFERARTRRQHGALVLAFVLGSLAVPIVVASPALAASYTCTPSNYQNSICQSLNATVNCVWNNHNGTFTAVFGYVNTSSTYDITTSSYTWPLNTVSPGADYQGQPSYFPRGTHASAFAVTFRPPYVHWWLAGDLAEATPSSTKCSGPPVPQFGDLTTMTRTLLLGLPLFLLLGHSRRLRTVLASIPTVFKETT